MGFWEQAHRGKVPFSSYIISRVHIINMIYDHDLWLLFIDHLDETVFVSVFILSSWEGSTLCGPHLRGGRYAAPPPFRVKYPNKLFGILLHGEICLFSPFINLFNHLFIIDSWIFVLHLGYN